MSTARFFVLSVVAIGVLSSVVWLTREREWVPQSTPPAFTSGTQAPVLHVRITEGAHKEHLAVTIQLASPEPSDIALTVMCGTERVLAGDLELSPLGGNLNPPSGLPNVCGHDNMALANQAVLRMFFPLPKSLGRHLLFQLPRIGCSGKACADLIVPATIEFESKPAPNRLFTARG